MIERVFFLLLATDVSSLVVAKPLGYNFISISAQQHTGILSLSLSLSLGVCVSLSGRGIHGTKSWYTTVYVPRFNVVSFILVLSFSLSLLAEAIAENQGITLTLNFYVCAFYAIVYASHCTTPLTELTVEVAWMRHDQTASKRVLLTKSL